MTERLLTPAEAASILRVAAQTLKDWRHKRIGPVWVKQGTRVFYDPADIQAYIDASKQGGAS